jgi:hypothetical protein
MAVLPAEAHKRHVRVIVAMVSVAAVFVSKFVAAVFVAPGTFLVTVAIVAVWLFAGWHFKDHLRGRGCG